MQFRILGPVQVRDGDRDLAVTGMLLRRLVARLALDAGAAVGQSELIATLWPADRPADAANALQSLVSRMRRLLGDGSLVQQAPGGGYRLDAARTDVDCWRAVEWHATGRRELADGHPAAAAATLTSVRQLFHGEPLADLADVPELVGAVGRFAELRLDVLADLMAAQLALGRAAEILPDLESLAAAELLRERFTGQLMTALATVGRSAEALAAYERLRRHLADELGVDPSPALQEQHLRLLRGDQVAPATATHQSNLRTFLTSFVGREAELGRIRQLLDGHRLTTIVGPGGVGKTRLSAQAAGAWVPLMRDGVWMVELAPIQDAAGVSSAVLEALGSRAVKALERLSERAVRESSDRLFDLLEPAECLLIMDNCEHLIEPVAELVDRILGRCPAVHVLATSREPLGIVGEALITIAPLGLPPQDCPLADASHYPAVRLLLDRAAATGEFALTADTLAPTIEVVRRLDGLPLAIELAAARLRVLPIEEIASRLSDRFRLLSGGNRAALPRHRTLRAVVEWSWDLLSPAERLVAERLSVFPAGATPQSATVVGLDDRVDPADVPDLLLALADKSLLQPSAGPELRYRMLETIREFGIERLAEQDEVAAARRAHARYFAALAERLDPVLRTADQLTAIGELRAERENILAALRFLIDDGEFDRAIELTGSMCWFWTLTELHHEALGWLTVTLNATTGSTHPERVVLEAMRAITTIFGDRSDDVPDLWEHHQTTFVELARRLSGVAASRPEALILRAVLVFLSGDVVLTRQVLEESADHGDDWVRAATLVLRAGFAENEGDVETMRASSATALELFERIGDRWGLSAALGIRAAVGTFDGELAAAVADLESALRYTKQFGAVDDDLNIHLRLADLRLRLGDPDSARTHLEMAGAAGSGRPTSVERDLMTTSMTAGVALEMGELERARSLIDGLDTADAGLTGPPRGMRGHLAAMVGGVRASVELAAGELDAARADLQEAYAAAVSTLDLMIIATIGVVVATFAGAFGQDVEAAVILGAAARLRGADDPTELRIARLTSRLRDELGEAFEDFYTKGRRYTREEAIAALDPARL